MGFERAKREKIYPKVALIGASGSGKSYSALRLATGYINKLGENKEIYYIDSEGGRGRYYADKFNYNYMEITDYSPESYIKAIDEAINTGNCGVLIIDSITHEWSAKGGILDIHSKMPGNSYTNWSKLTPRHNRFIDKILLSPICVISTVRGKDQYTLEEKNGKQVPKKVGLGGETRQNFEYEMTLAFNIDQDTHVATASKDNTGVFDNKYDVLDEESGSKIYDWANSGDAYITPKKVIEETNTKKIEEEKSSNKVKLESIIKDIDVTAKEKAKIDKDKVVDAIKKHHKNANYNSIKDVEVAKSVLEELKKIK